MSFNDELNKTNSHKIVLLEMDTPLDATWINYGPGRWVFIVTPGSQDVPDDFGNIGFYGNRNGAYQNIQSVNVGGDQLTEMASFAAWEATSEGWFYDEATTKLYIVLEDFNPPEFYVVVAPGAAIGFSYLADDNKYYQDVYYEPRLIDVPNLSKSKDPLYYGIIQYQAPSFSFNNEDGFFDTFSQLALYNQPYRVFYIFAGLAYSEALQVYQGRIKEFAHDFTTFKMIGKDPRESLSRQLPINTFSNSDSSLPFYFAGIADKDDGKPVPIAFGPVIGGRAYRTSSGNWTFADTTFNSILATISVYDKDGVSFSHGGTETDGTFTGADPSPLKDLYVDFTQDTVKNGLDVISDNAANYEGIAFNSSNYDLVEWTSEKYGVKDMGLWIGDGNLMTTADIVEQVCNDNQGIFDPLADGRFTFRTLNPKRVPTHEIFEDETLDDGSMIHPTDEVLSSIKVAYSEDLLEKQDRFIHNLDFQAEVFGIMGDYREQPKPYKTRLTTKADAQTLSVKIMDQSSKIPNTIILATKTQNIGLRILDNCIYWYKRQNGNTVLARSRFQVLGIDMNLSNFELYLTIRQIREDDDTYFIIDGGDSTTDYDYYDGGDSTTTPDVTIQGGGA